MLSEDAAMSSGRLSPAAFACIRDLFHRESGIRLAEHKSAFVAARLQRRLHELGMPDFDRYCTQLQQPQERIRAVELLTTHETFFFREPAHFEHLAQHALPSLPHRPLRVWCAACATGEEAYSLAMVLAEQLGDSPWQVVASDLSTQALARAQAGLYRLQRLEQLPQPLLQRYCLRGVNEHQGWLRVDEGLRERISFRRHNLLDDARGLGDFDVVFLRNVLIYFGAEVKHRALQAVVARLRPGGWLYTGHADTLGDLELPVALVRPSIYRRPFKEPA